MDCNLERAQLNEEVSRLRGYIARWQSSNEGVASLQTPTADFSPQLQSYEVSIPPENSDMRLESGESVSTSEQNNHHLEIDSQEGTKVTTDLLNGHTQIVV